MLRYISLLLAAVLASPAPAWAQAPGSVLRDCPDCPEMVVVPAGSYIMGSPEKETGRGKDEGPQRSVSIPRPIAIGRHEITRGQFGAFVRDTGYEAQGHCWYWNGSEGKHKNDEAARNWSNPGYTQGDAHPVVCVSWSDARAYAEWLSKKTSKSYRLPTEAEWEYAARAGAGTSRPWGEDPKQACLNANVGDLTRNRDVPPGKGLRWILFHDCDDRSAHTSDAGSYQANAFGLYDMLGNAWEWTEDCYHPSHSGSPTDGSAWQSRDCSVRVVRGGGWDSSPRIARAAARRGVWAGDRDDILGFRLARTLTDP